MRLSFLLLAVVVGCSNADEAAEPSADATSSADTFTPETASDTATADTGSVDVAADVPTEKTYTMSTNQCFTFATTAIGESFTDGSIERCGDFTLEGASSPFLVGIDGTMCSFEGTYTSLESIPKSAGPCGRVINLGGDKDRGFLVKVDATHHYRVHVLASSPKLVFSFDLIKP